MLFSFLSSGDFRSALISILLTLPIILIALSFHEAAHAYAAYKMGDRTAFNLGRVTFNPIKHIDPMGFLCMLIFGYGWAKPVPINSRNFNNPRKGMALTALAGPLTNFILGVVSVLLYSLTLHIINIESVILMLVENELAFNIATVLLSFFYLSSLYNLLLMVFNLIPVPPFDGSRIINVFLPPKLYFSIMKYERYTLFIVLGISFICSRAFNFSPFFWVAEKLFDLLLSLANMLFGLLF